MYVYNKNLSLWVILSRSNTSVSGNFFTDQIGRFPNKSSRGNQYIMVAYDHDSNAILAEPIKRRVAEELLRAIKAIHRYLSNKGLHPSLQILDNECPAVVKQLFRQEQVKFNLYRRTCIATIQQKRPSGLTRTALS